MKSGSNWTNTTYASTTRKRKKNRRKKTSSVVQDKRVNSSKSEAHAAAVSGNKHPADSGQGSVIDQVKWLENLSSFAQNIDLNKVNHKITEVKDILEQVNNLVDNVQQHLPLKKSQTTSPPQTPPHSTATSENVNRSQPSSYYSEQTSALYGHPHSPYAQPMSHVREAYDYYPYDQRYYR